jgi:hypothetical protein
MEENKDCKARERKLNFFELCGNNKFDHSNTLLGYFLVVYGCSDMEICNDAAKFFFMDLACSKTKRPPFALKNSELLARKFKTDGSISAPTGKKTIRKMAE